MSKSITCEILYPKGGVLESYTESFGVGTNNISEDLIPYLTRISLCRVFI